MTKMFLVCCALIAFAFFSCDKKEVKPNYLDNKLIEGTWYERTSYDSTVYVFKGNKATHEYYAKIIDMAELKFEHHYELGTYLINDSSIFFPIRKDRNCEYKLAKENNDSLYIKLSEIWQGFKRLE